MIEILVLTVIGAFIGTTVAQICDHIHELIELRNYSKDLEEKIELLECEREDPKKMTLLDRILLANGADLDALAKKLVTTRMPGEGDPSLRARVLNNYADVMEHTTGIKIKEKSHESTTDII